MLSGKILDSGIRWEDNTYWTIYHTYSASVIVSKHNRHSYIIVLLLRFSWNPAYRLFNDRVSLWQLAPYTVLWLHESYSYWSEPFTLMIIYNYVILIVLLCTVYISWSCSCPRALALPLEIFILRSSHSPWVWKAFLELRVRNDASEKGLIRSSFPERKSTTDISMTLISNMHRMGFVCLSHYMNA